MGFFFSASIFSVPFLTSLHVHHLPVLISCLLCILSFHLQSDIYFVSSAPVSSASNCSSRDTSSQSSPQTPTGYEMPVFPSPLGDGKPHTAKTPEDVDITASILKVCKMSVLPTDLFDFGCCKSSRTIYINLSQQNGSLKLQPFSSGV